MNELAIPQDLMSGSLLHFESGVPIDDLNINAKQRRRLARVQHVYWQWVRNPFLEYKMLFRQLVKGKYADPPSETRAAQKDVQLFEFVINHVAPPSRAVATAKVRAIADRLMKNGMETDNGKDMAEGAKIAMKLDRLDQPESEQADMTKVMFLPPVVTTNVSDVDDTKQAISDQQALAIINKYGAFVDPKRKMIEERVATMEAAAGPAEEAEYVEEKE